MTVARIISGPMVKGGSGREAKKIWARTAMGAPQHEGREQADRHRARAGGATGEGRGSRWAAGGRRSVRRHGRAGGLEESGESVTSTSES